jgi:hypothetical protein
MERIARGIPVASRLPRGRELLHLEGVPSVLRRAGHTNDLRKAVLPPGAGEAREVSSSSPKSSWDKSPFDPSPTSGENSRGTAESTAIAASMAGLHGAFLRGLHGTKLVEGRGAQGALRPVTGVVSSTGQMSCNSTSRQRDCEEALMVECP